MLTFENLTGQFSWLRHRLWRICLAKGKYSLKHLPDPAEPTLVYRIPF